MAQIDKGLRSLLTMARSYDLLQNLLGVEKVRRTLAAEYIEAQVGMRVLDIGCGTGGILAYLPQVSYVGFDMNARYIEAAQLHYGPRGTFVHADVNQSPAEAEGTFDRVLAIGLLHHLNDAEVRSLMALARRLLAPGGRLVTFDCCYRDGQPALARFLIDRDRGQDTRTEAGYLGLARETFPSTQIVLREDLLRVPYTHAIMSCS